MESSVFYAIIGAILGMAVSAAFILSSDGWNEIKSAPPEDSFYVANALLLLAGIFWGAGMGLLIASA